MFRPWSTLFVFIVFLLDCSTAFASPKKIANDPARMGVVTSKNFKQLVPIRWSGGLPPVEVEIAGEKYTFLLDTPSSYMFQDFFHTIYSVCGLECSRQAISVIRLPRPFTVPMPVLSFS